jgi:predicted transcriptional regulator
VAVTQLQRDSAGRPLLTGAATLPPMEAPPAADGPAARSNRNAAGRFAVLNEFVDCRLAGLSGAEVACWLVLYRDTRNGTASTSQTDMARRAGCKVRTVQRALQTLVTKGLVVVVYHGGLNRGPSRYRVTASG